MSEPHEHSFEARLRKLTFEVAGETMVGKVWKGCPCGHEEVFAETLPAPAPGSETSMRKVE